MRQVEIVRIDLSLREAQRVTDFVAEEKPLSISINDKHYATIFSSPSDLEELTVGHLLTEGLIKSIEEIERVHVNEEICRINLKSSVDVEKRLKLASLYQRVILSACGSVVPYRFRGRMPKVKSDLVVKGEEILKSVHQLNSLAGTFRKTGGVHVAAICSVDGTVLVLSEDVGRHNAVDKAIGKGAMASIHFDESFLALSGRLTGDIVLKAARTSIPVVASLAGAIDSGIKIAADAGVTIVGFVRGRRMNVYTFAERIMV